MAFPSNQPSLLIQSVTVGFVDACGGGIGTAIVGWLLEMSGYVGTNLTQPDSAIRMLQVMYLWLPFVFEILITILLSRMNVEKTNERIIREKGMTAESRR